MSKDTKRKVLGQIKRPNTDQKSFGIKPNEKKINFEKFNFNYNKNEEINILEQEEEENESMLWDNQKKEETLELQKQKIISIRKKLFQEKTRIMKKQLNLNSKRDYLNDLSNVYQKVKDCLEPNSTIKTDSIISQMNEVRFPEDFEEEQEIFINEHIFDVPPPKPRSLPSLVLSMNERDYREFIQLNEQENEKKESEFVCEIPTDENIESNFDENMIPLYTNWLRLLTDEVEDLQQEEIHMDHSLGEIDTNIDRISDLIHVGMIDLGMVNENE